MAERVLAIDPGEKIGWAHGLITTREAERVGLPVSELEVTGHGITAAQPFVLKLAEAFANYDTVIYEIYRISGEKGKLRAHIGSEVPTLQTIGMIRMLGWQNPSVNVVRQTTGARDTGYTFAAGHLPQVQEIIDRLPATHDDAHDGDALAHLAGYFHKNYV